MKDLNNIEKEKYNSEMKIIFLKIIKVGFKNWGNLEIKKTTQDIIKTFKKWMQINK